MFDWPICFEPQTVWILNDVEKCTETKQRWNIEDLALTATYDWNGMSLAKKGPSYSSDGRNCSPKTTNEHPSKQKKWNKKAHTHTQSNTKTYVSGDMQGIKRMLQDQRDNVRTMWNLESNRITDCVTWMGDKTSIVWRHTYRNNFRQRNENIARITNNKSAIFLFSKL